MSDPQNLPDILQARLRLGLYNWGKRTLIWTAVLALFSTQVPFVKVLLIGWILFSAISLVGLLLGLKLASALKTGSTTAFPQGMNQPRDVGGGRPEPLGADDYPSPHTPTGRNSVSDEIIEIEAEVLPPEPDSRRVP